VTLRRALPGLELRVHAASEWSDRPDALARCKDDIARADIVIATTGVRGLIRPEMVRTGQVILALSNPDPEIEPQAALAAGAAFAADGKSINNVLGFPGLFRGALDAGARRFTDEMLVAAAETIADLAEAADLVPDSLNPAVHAAVAEAVARAAVASGAC
jgi:malate dehydrogenase (oxaloacetate-decarboxylating)